MQPYSQGFARAYNLRWSGFARQVAPLILDFYAATPIGHKDKTVLDLCCGAGMRVNTRADTSMRGRPLLSRAMQATSRSMSALVWSFRPMTRSIISRTNRHCTDVFNAPPPSVMGTLSLTSTHAAG
jgi:hypothetical protein